MLACRLLNSIPNPPPTTPPKYLTSMVKEADPAHYARLCSTTAAAVAGDDDDETTGVSSWEIGLPMGDDLTPLSQFLIPPNLAAAFGITPEPPHTLLDVHRASQNTISVLTCSNSSSSSSSSSSKSFPPFVAPRDDPMVPEPDPAQPDDYPDDVITRSTKRPRLVWTPQLHKRFVDVIDHLGIKTAVPKTIMQMMNVEGLTRENVASHLQKYRLYVKRMHGLSSEGPSSSDHLFASTPVPVPYPGPTAIPTPVFNMPHYHGFEMHNPYGSFGNNYGAMISRPRVMPNDK